MKGLCTELHRSADGGTTWAEISDIYNLTVGDQQREIIEDDDLLNCAADTTRLKEPGAKTIGDYAAEARWNPSDQAANNTQNQHLLKEDFDNQALYLYKIKFTDAQNSGEIVHGFVSQLGPVEIAPNDQVRRTFTITPTGKYHTQEEDIDTVAVPAIS